MVFKKICEILHSIGIEGEISKNDFLIDNLGIDSTEMASLIIDLKKKFDVNLDETACWKMTVADIIKIIEQSRH